MSPPCELLLQRSPYKARQVFNDLLNHMQLAEFGFTWYSLRRGGATFFFERTGNMEATLEKGRWQSTKGARTYISQAVTEVVELALSDHQQEILQETVSLLNFLWDNEAFIS